MEKIDEFFNINNLSGELLGIIIAILGISISILLVFWWQAAHIIFDHLRFLILEGRYYKEKNCEKFEQIFAQAKFERDRLYKLQFFSKILLWFVLPIYIMGFALPMFLSIFRVLYDNGESLSITLDFLFSILKGQPKLISKDYYKFFFGLMTIATLITVAIIFLVLLVSICFRVSQILPEYVTLLEITFNFKNNQTKKGFTMLLSYKQAFYIGVMGAISFVLAFVLGSAINALTGIPLTGGILNGIIVGAMITIGIKGVDKFGAATLIWFVFTIFAIPTITFGPPGWYKVIVGLISGIIWDILISLFKRSKFGYIFSAGVGAVAITYGVFIAVKILGLPAAEKLAKALYLLLPLNFIISSIGAMVGLWLFGKYISKMSFLQNLKD